MAKVIIFGLGQLSELAYYFLKNDSDHDIVAFTVDKGYQKINSFYNLPVVDFDEIEKKFNPHKFKLFIPISYSNLNTIRKNKYFEAKKKNYKFINYISSNCINNSISVGENSFILEGNNLQPFSKVGNNVIMWSGNHLGHHSSINDHCFISSHVVISGSVTINESCFIGVNASIGDNIMIGYSSIIGAGATITKSIPDNAIVRPQKNIISIQPDRRKII
jgi:sugar O-acyltransferase (sialic acid O-acetyltransferase NeuD family)